MKNDQQQDKKLSQLLQFKRFEKPSEATWMQFEFALERKRLEINSVSRTFSWLQKIFSRKSFVFAGNLAMVAAVAFIFASGYKNPMELNKSHYAQHTTNDKFVMDEINLNGVTNLQANVFNIDRKNNGVNYVCDTVYALHSPANFNYTSY